MLLLLLALAGTVPVEGTLERVVDGNTILVSVTKADASTSSEVVRIAELDCPSVATVSGQLARKRAQALWEPGLKVTLSPAGKRFTSDRQKRTLAQVKWPDDKGMSAMVGDRLCKRVVPKRK